jgi:murein DD-endopeptidase MepM/ murein hydrolase activator NlpD
MKRAALIVLLSAFFSATLAAEEVWVFLKNGSVGRADLAAEPVVVRLPDGSSMEAARDEIVRSRSDGQMADAVDRMLKDVRRGRKTRQHAGKLRVYGPAAVPRLLHHLHGKDPADRGNALWAFCFAWSPDAKDPVVACLKDSNVAIRKGALAALTTNESLKDLTEVFEGIIVDPDPVIAILGFETAERAGPDVNRLARFLTERKCWPMLARFLPRYQAPVLIPGVLEMLEKGKEEERRAAVVTLIHLNDSSEATRSRMLRLLGRSSPETRERIGEYLAYHGTTGELATLRKRLGREKDPYAGASIAAAVAVIESRAEWMPDGVSDPKGSGGVTGTPGGAAPETRDAEALRLVYDSARALLEPTPTLTAWKRAFAIYRTAEAFEPRYRYDGSLPPEDLRDRAESRLELQSALFAIPGANLSGETEFNDRVDLPTAGRLQPPIRDYFDRERKSFGKDTGAGTGVFANSVHVGDDVGWLQDHLTVTAIGAGIVRRAEYSFTWGGLVIIEHQGKMGERFCSLYAHLSPFKHVKPGELVERGRKIGSIGRTYTLENGGYAAHLHFSIHEGPFINHHEPGDEVVIHMVGVPTKATVVEVRKSKTLYRLDSGAKVLIADEPKWITGYISPEKWKEGNHRWIDPQAFLGKW